MPHAQLNALANYQRVQDQLTFALRPSRHMSALDDMAAPSRRISELVEGPARRATEMWARPAALVNDSFSNAARAAFMPRDVISGVAIEAGRWPRDYLGEVARTYTDPVRRVNELTRRALDLAAEQARYEARLGGGFAGLGRDHVWGLGDAWGLDDSLDSDDANIGGHPEWVVDFYARVVELAPSEQRALVLSLLGIAVFAISTAVTWGTVGGVSAYISVAGLVKAILDLANRISALYEDEGNDG